MKEDNIYRIAITGPEATGKSALAVQLAKYFDTNWVPEFAREYLGGIGRHYIFEDLKRIAMEQYRSEEILMKSAKNYLFCDTDMLVMYIWSMDKFEKCDRWIEEKLEENRYDYHLLCNTDIPWSPDPLREDPERREDLFGRYLRELEKRSFRFGIVEGTGDERIENAINLIRQTFGNSHEA